MKTFKVEFIDKLIAEDEEDAYRKFLDYLEEVLKFEDLTAFKIELETEKGEET